MRDEIVELLQRRGTYRLAPEPLHIADVEFRFAAVLQGPPSNPSMVVLLDEPEESIRAALRRLRAFRTVLSRSGTRRPLTTVILSPDVSANSIHAIREISRVIVADDPDLLEVALRPLLPLELPDADTYTTNVDNLLQVHLRDESGSPVLKRLLAASGRGADDVRETLRKAVAKVSEEALKAAAEKSDD